MNDAGLERITSMSCPNFNKRATVIALDGGPCSGKSSVMAGLETAEFDHPILFIPEIATEVSGELLEQGLDFPSLAVMDRCRYRQYQKRIVGGYIARIGAARRVLSETGGVIVTDRSPAGVQVYVRPHEWAEITEHCGTSPDKVIHEYADTVIFLRSLAVENPVKYDAMRRSNPIRTETVKQARQLHEVSRAVWRNHPDVIEIGGDDVSDKLRFVREHIARLSLL